MKKLAFWQRFHDAVTLRRFKLLFFMTVAGVIIVNKLMDPHIPTEFIRKVTSHVLQLDINDMSEEKNRGNSFHNFYNCFESPSCASKNATGCLMKDTFECKHLMTLQQYRGRTGNNIFQVAALLGSASYHGYTAVLDNSTFLTKLFDLPNLFDNTKLLVNQTSDTTLSDKIGCNFNERVRNLSHDSNWTLDGMFQSWKYFEGFENVISESFRLKDHLAREARTLIKSKVGNNTQTICIHVRRGDFLSYQNRGFTVAPLEYIKKAMGYFRNKYKRVHFFAVSDDKEWCRNNLRSANVTISPFKTLILDMALMIESDHVIVTSGTFGWWGAWLSGGETVYWTGFPGKKSRLANKTVNEYYYPRHWIGLS